MNLFNAMQGNHSVEEFIAVGFIIITQYRPILFILLVILYITIVSSNAITSYAIFREPRLHTPMYFLIGALSVIELAIVTAGYPTLFTIVLAGRAHISVNHCLLQMYVFHSLLITENCLLNVMAYDRYLAIANPLRYHAIMSSRRCNILIAACFFFGFVVALCLLIPVSRTVFCGPNEIHHIICDSSPLLTLSCGDNMLIIIVDLVVSSFTLIFTFFSSVVTYIRILFTIAKMRTSEERRKAFSVCATHLITAFVFYGSVALMYIKLQISYSTDYDVAAAIHHLILAPFFTPILYSLRSKQVKDFLKKCLRSKKVFTANIQVSSIGNRETASIQ